MKYDVIVVGAGHSGCEAAYASARLGSKTCLITTKKANIAMAPCNPSIGGPAKGVVVREIDALGGLMGRVSDQSMLQIKLLNRSKGPAVHAMRAQIDIIKYPQVMIEILENTDNLEILEAMVSDLIIKAGVAQGVRLSSGLEISAKSVVITTGTYMDSLILKGHDKVSSGPCNTSTSKDLSSSLKELGIELFRLKTGTPARVKKSSIDFDKASVVGGDLEHLNFSFYQKTDYDFTNASDCHLIYTTPKTHEIITSNIDKCAMYSGVIKGVGPRYCPSIEDKLVRFADKDRHQLFLEPESASLDSIYVQGFSTSMPEDIQLKMLQSLPGLDNVEVITYGYAIEYDAVKPEQLRSTLEFKNIKGLFSAGQINGTSGYEEAAGQGIIAGINASLKVENKPEFILTRADSYIGLMIDDLVTKGTQEPYRLLTSRSEYRLILRSDNADQRLSQRSYEIGLLSDSDFNIYLKKMASVEKCMQVLKETKVTSKIFTTQIAEEINTAPLAHSLSAYEFLKRPQVTAAFLKQLLDLDFKVEIITQIEIEVKYSGYINKIENQIARQTKVATIKIPKNIDYDAIHNIALEAKDKLKKINPENIGQASNISGINPTDISVLEIFIQGMEIKEY